MKLVLAPVMGVAISHSVYAKEDGINATTKTNGLFG